MSKLWTDAQKEAICFQGNNLLVAAGAGAGKTGVLVERVIRKITDPHTCVSIEQLLVLTFTNAAAIEMRQRIAKSLEKETAAGNPQALHQLMLLNQASITTIHSFCLNLLRTYFYHLDLDPAFQIAQETEMDLLKEDVLTDLLEENYRQAQPVFLELVACYGGREDEDLRQFILQLYESSRSQTAPLVWLDTLATVFAKPLDKDTVWLQELCREAYLDMAEAVRLLGDACELAAYYGFMSYLGQLEKEKKDLCDLLSSFTGDWQQAQAAFAKDIFTRLKSEKGSEEERENVKSLRTQAKNMFLFWGKHYFCRSLEKYSADIAQIAPLMQELARLTKEFSAALQKQKQRKNLIDFSDMEQLALQLLQNEQNGVAQELRASFAEVIIDEYQDINDVQEAILRAVSRADNRFMVGDDKQSIYRFRMAQPRLFLEKKEAYQAQDEGQVILLRSNFRSSPIILQGINFLFRQIMSKTCGEIDYRENVFLQPGATDLACEAPPIEYYLLEQKQTAPDTNQEEESAEAPSAAAQEARLIAARIAALHEEGYAYRDMVVLMRSPRYWLKSFLEEFNAAGIPVYGEQNEGYFATAEIQLMIAVLQVLDNVYQDISLAAVLRSPFGEFSLDDLAAVSLAGKESYYADLLSCAQGEDELARRCRQFLADLERWQKQLRTGSITDFMEKLYQEKHFFDWTGALPAGNQKQANLRAFYQLAKEYEESSYRGLYGFLRFINRVIEKGSDIGNARTIGENEDIVRLQSIHSAKGLEYKVVFVAGLGRRFNSRDMQGPLLLHRDLGIGPIYRNREQSFWRSTLPREAISRRLHTESIAEEMRILYVAFTRAKERLILVGGMRNLPAAVMRWAQTISFPDWYLPPVLISGAATPMDWLGRALIRHRDGLPLRNYTQPPIEAKGNGQTYGESGAWSLHIGSLKEILARLYEPAAEKQAASPRSEQRNSAQAAVVADILGWRYPYLYSLDKQAKWTVTDVNKRYFALENVGDSALWPLGQIPQTRVPDKIELGLSWHYVLQYLNLQGDSSKEGLQKTVAAWQLAGKLTDRQARLVDCAALSDFLNGPLGSRLRKASVVRREFSFLYALPAEAIYADWPSQDEQTVLLQGTVDAVFLEDGAWMLLDYKTGHFPGEEKAVRSYGKQLQLYRQALKDIWRAEIKETWLCYLDSRQTIKID